MMSTDQNDGGAAHSLALFDGPSRPVPGPEPLTAPVYAYVESLSPASQEAVWKLCWLCALYHPMIDPPRRGEELGGKRLLGQRLTRRRKPNGTGACR